MDVFATVGTSLRLSDVFHSVVDHRWAALTTHILVGVVTYYGKHYSTFFYHTKLQVWIYFDDATVREIGPHWEQVVEKCRKGRYQPLLLLYAVQDVLPVGPEGVPCPRRSMTPSPEKNTPSPGPQQQQSNCVDGLSVPEHLNIPRRRDSGNWSGDRNSASSSSSTSMENPYPYLPAQPRNPVTTTSGPYDGGYDSYSLSSNDSLPLQQGLKHNLQLAQIPEGAPDDCERMCQEADKLLDKARLAEEASDLQGALVMCYAAVHKARAAMDAPYNNPHTLAFAQMKHNTCVMKARSLNRRLVYDKTSHSSADKEEIIKQLEDTSKKNPPAEVKQGKKQHRIRRKLLMGGLIRRKNRSMPDLRDDQDGVVVDRKTSKDQDLKDSSTMLKSSQDDSTLLLKGSGKVTTGTLSGYLSEGHLEYSGATNPNLEKSRLMRKSFHGSLGRALHIAKVPPPPPLRTTSQLSAKSAQDKVATQSDRQQYPLPTEPVHPSFPLPPYPSPHGSVSHSRQASEDFPPPPPPLEVNPALETNHNALEHTKSYSLPQHQATSLLAQLQHKRKEILEKEGSLLLLKNSETEIASSSGKTGEEFLRELQAKQAERRPAKKSLTKKKSVTFCDQVILVATAEDEVEDSYIPNHILERVLRQQQSQIVQTSSAYSTQQQPYQPVGSYLAQQPSQSIGSYPTQQSSQSVSYPTQQPSKVVGSYLPQQPSQPVGSYSAQQPSQPVGSYSAQQPSQSVGSYSAEQPSQPVGSYTAQQPSQPVGSYSAQQPSQPVHYPHPSAAHSTQPYTIQPATSYPQQHSVPPLYEDRLQKYQSSPAPGTPYYHHRETPKNQPTYQRVSRPGEHLPVSPPYQNPPPPRPYDGNKTRALPCHLCRKKLVVPPTEYCGDCEFYMMRFRPKN
ncbi:unnamed protein product [Timema podura]|uniref:USP domain-containing protein n=1 Tax=Timema podura TaxID=61482 RepID=A0ABN7P1W7_TIMPD|nr:unnamed protein product [Timema podura]